MISVALFTKPNQENESSADDIPKRKKFKKIPKKFIAIALLLAICGGAAAKFFLTNQTAQEQEWNYVKAEKRDVKVVLTGSGTVEPNDQYNVTASVKGEILECTFNEGDNVEKGQLLYKIDPSEAENSIKKSEISIEKSKMSYSETLENLKNLSVTSDKSGVITKVYISEGDDIQNGTKIADLRDSSVMELEIPFNASDVSAFWIGESAVVTLDNSFETLSGTVSEISGSETVLDGYQIVKYVTIKVNNPGGLSTSSYASATIGGKACNSGANFTYNAETTITAKSSGTVANLLIKEGTSVRKDQKIAELSSTSITNQVKSGQLSLDDAQLSLENLYDKLDDYTIAAPISGTVITKNSKLGDTLDNTNGATAMAVIYDLSKLTFDMTIDELDISKIKVGQKVSITADAIDGKTFSGHVEKISVSGSSENGVTSYPVTIAIDDPPESLLPGMNVNASIEVEAKENVLCIPVSAVNRGNMVYVDKNSDSAKASSNNAPSSRQAPSSGENSNTPSNSNTSSKKSNTVKKTNGTKSIASVPDGYTSVKVETGINDDNYIEITSGLAEGDTVAIAVVKNSETTATQSTFAMGGGGSGNRGMNGGGQGGPPPGM